MKKISILGCGWLGLPLAKSLIEKGFSIKGSTTSEEKLQVLQNAGIQPFLISIKFDKVVGDVVNFLNESDILIIDIPPDLRSGNTESFIEKMKQSIPFLEKSSIKKIIFVSPTSPASFSAACSSPPSPCSPPLPRAVPSPSPFAFGGIQRS